MNKDIIRMAREAGLHLYVNDLTEEPYALILQRFAALVRADEREACAKLFDDRDNGIGFYEPHEPAEMIRARSAR